MILTSVTLTSITSSPPHYYNDGVIGGSEPYRQFISTTVSPLHSRNQPLMNLRMSLLPEQVAQSLLKSVAYSRHIMFFSQNKQSMIFMYHQPMCSLETTGNQCKLI